MKSLRQELDWGKFAPLRLRARGVAEGAYVGSHKSARRGAGVEFGGHRAYTPGDDLRFIDRHALMRHGSLLVREFETETDRDLWLFVDATASMSYQSEGAPGPKYGFAALLAAALAYVAVRSGDRVALDFIGGKNARPLPPRAGREAFERVVTALEPVLPEGDLGEQPELLSHALGQAQKSARRGAVQILLSDMLDLPPKALAAFSALTSRDRSLTVVQTLDPAERDFPFEGAIRLKALEGRANVETDARSARKAYLAALAAEQARLASELSSRRARFMTSGTDDAPELLVHRILRGAEDPNP